MNLSGYFIDRPIFASVISIVIFIVGLISMFNLPISEYPEVSPPSVVVSAQFPGANSSTVADTVAAPLEEQINGVEGMIYMNSLASSDGAMSLTVTFEIGTDPDLAQQLVQNRVSQALPRLPEVTRQLGVTVVKSSPDLTMVVHMVSPKGQYDALYLRNYAVLNVKDELAKIQGVGRVAVFGSGDYAMRVWLDPNKIAERNMSAQEVVQSIRAQNIQVAGGVIGGPPYTEGVQTQLNVNVQGRLETPEEFEEIIIKRDANGVITRLGDVAKIELDASTYSLRSMLNNEQAAAMPIFAAPGANALELSTNVRARMAELAEMFPDDVEYEIIYDPTVFVKHSIEAVIHTLLEAVLLVVIVVLVFLQTWRATIIPFLAVPVSIIGTFAFMLPLDFSINVLTLFGLILSVGIVVDDAIVVVENVERNIEEGKSPRDATIQAMKEVTGPIIATFLVIAAVFVPIAFISGLTGMFYRQFALTITIATGISAFNSLTLSPAIAALLLKPHDAPKDRIMKVMDFLFGWFFRLFNKGFGKAQHGYSHGVVGFITRRFVFMILCYVGLVAFTAWSFNLVPPGFVPAQDKQYLIGMVQLPSGANLERTDEVVQEMSDIALSVPGVENAVQFPGLSINGFVNSPSAGIVFLPLKSFEERSDPSQSAFAIMGQLQQKFGAIDEAFVAVFPPPSVRGLGSVGGFKLQIQDRGDMGFKALDEITQQVVQKAMADPAIAVPVLTNYNVNVPQLYADIDRTKAQQLGIPMSEIFSTMQIYLGSLYVNDFNLFGRTYQVIAQADKEFRSQPSDINRLQVRNMNGDMVPLGAVTNVERSFGPETAMRYNGFRSADITGNPSPGYSSGQAQAAIMKILDETLPQGMAYEWTELTYQQIKAGNTAMIIFPLCIFLVFLVLAAQYESLSLPMAVILIVPMAILSAILGIYFFGKLGEWHWMHVASSDNNIFTQISLFVLAGLACKNAILIVEFARELEHQGRTIGQAAREAARLRLRPILMTSFAFIMGVLPLVIAHGAGAEMRQAIGIAVFSGMIGVTFFGLIFTPLFYVLMRRLEDKIKGKPLESRKV